MKQPLGRRRILRRAMVVIAGVLVCGLIASYLIAGALVAPRPAAVGAPPAALNASEFAIASDSGSTISGWHARREAGKGVVVLLHGIRGSRLSMLDRARMLYEAGYSTVLIDFQAHGESPGDQITLGDLERHDVRAAIEFARREHPHESIGVIGVSLGGAAALLASPLGVDAMVIESVYPTIEDAVRNRVAAKLGPLSPLASALLLMQLEPRLGVAPSELRPIDHMPNLGCPVFVVSGRLDRHTTAAETVAMYLAAQEPKDLWLVDDVAHEDLYHSAPEQYRERVLQFLDLHNP